MDSENLRAIQEEQLRALRKVSASQPLTAARLQELDDLYERIMEEPEKIETKIKRMRLVVGFVTSSIFGLVYDKVGLALGVPPAWIGENVFVSIWHRIF